MKNRLTHLNSTRNFLRALIDSPNIVQIVRNLSPPRFSELIQTIGVEDAGEIIALATVDQLVAAFDEDLFANEAPGEREAFDGERFARWLEVLLEAGDEAVADKMTKLSEDFVIKALSSIVLVLDYDALLTRMSIGDDAAHIADKALESSLSEEIDGYLLVSKVVDGWDAAMALILALDSRHRSFLERILDRCSAIDNEYTDDLEALVSQLSAAESLAEDVESEREHRRGELGYVEPRAASAFLKLARTSGGYASVIQERDPLTKAYFRELDRGEPSADNSSEGLDALLLRITPNLKINGSAPALPGENRGPVDKYMALVEALQLLRDEEPTTFRKRMEELVYLANVIAAGAGTAAQRFRPAEAAEAAFATVSLGASIEAGCPNPENLCNVLRESPADLLFRRASGLLVAVQGEKALGILQSRKEIDEVYESLLRAR